MAEFARVQVQQTTTVPSESSGQVTFRPAEPGDVTVFSTFDNKKPRSETNKAARLELLKPGSGTAVATIDAPVGTTQLGVSYTATAADLAVPGNWICRLSNESLVALTFNTLIGFVSPYPLQKATFDISLLQTLITQVMADAQLRLHLQSSAASDDPRSRITWSPGVAAMIGATEHDFHLDNINYDTNQISSALPDLHLLPNPLVFEFVFDSGVLSAPVFDRTQSAFVMTLTFAPTVITCDDPTTLEIDVASLQVTLTVGLDGRISAACQANAEARYHGVGVKDVGSTIQDAVTSAARTAIDPATLRSYFDIFFILLMRLNDTPPPSLSPVRSVTPYRGAAHVETYAVSGDALVASFYTIPQPTTIVTHA